MLKLHQTHYVQFIKKIINIKLLKVQKLFKVKVHTFINIFIDIKKLYQVKEKLLKLVDDVFNIHEQRLRNTIRTQYKIDPPDTTKLKQAIDQLEKILMKLGHASTVLPALKKSLLLDHESLRNYFSNIDFKSKKCQLS